MFSAIHELETNQRNKSARVARRRSPLGVATLGLGLAGLILVVGCSSSDNKSDGTGGKSSASSGGKSSATGGAAGSATSAPGGAAGATTAIGGRSSSGGTSASTQVGGKGGASSSAVGGASSGGVGTTGVGGATATGGVASVVGGAAGASTTGGVAGKATAAGFPDLTKPACVDCLTTICNDPIGENTRYVGDVVKAVMPACVGVTGVATDGPGAGVSRQRLCNDLFACMSRTRCALPANVPDPLPNLVEWVLNGGPNVSYCYCGRPKDGVNDNGACLEGTSVSGACKDEFEAAYESSSPGWIVPNIGAVDILAGASASQLMDCASFWCMETCYTR